MEDKDEQKRKILEDEDYVKAPKFNNSLKKMVSHYKDGAENNVIAKALMISEEEVEKLYEDTVQILRNDMGDGA